MAAVAGMLVLLILVLFGPALAPHEAIFFVVEHGADPRPYEPGLVFPFGSDVLGRDLLSLVIAGAPATLTITLVSGIARVVAGALVAALGLSSPGARRATEWSAELVSAIPATLVALVLVKVFVKAETGLLTFICALLVTGWAGPYRVIRSELDRLASMPFTQGAQALGVSRARLVWRHHLPHLLPILALNTSQQVVASLVLVAELGVLGVTVGLSRKINIEESLSRVLPTQVNTVQISDPPEWGGLLASARTVESLWTTRWLFLVPGLAFAITAVAIAVIGYGLARRYARRDVFDDVRGRGTAALALVVIGLCVTSSFVPPRYASAGAWATAAREAMGPTTGVERAFAQAGLRPLGAGYAVEREVTTIAQTGAASVTVGSTTVSEPWPRTLTDIPDRGRTARSLVTRTTGGGSVDGPLVFAARGISAADYQPQPQPLFGPRTESFEKLIRDYGYADDYAEIDVRGKVVLLVRFLGLKARGTRPGAAIVRGPSPDDSIANAIKRGAAAVIFVDPALWLYNDLPATVNYRQGELDGGINPYLRAELDSPPTSTGGVPVLVLGELAARQLVEPLGLDLAPLLRTDDRGDPSYRLSPARDLGVRAHVSVPLERRSASVSSYVGELRDAPPDAGRIVVWAIRREGTQHPSADVLTALARALAGTRLPFVFVDFDPSLDSRAIADVLTDRRIALVLVLDRLDGSRLRFTTPYGDLIPAFDLYAQRAGARFDHTLETAGISALEGLAPFSGIRTVVITGNGGDADTRGEAVTLLGYVAGRIALGAEELPR